MGRYDKIRVYNGSSWVQPNNMYAYTGSSWVHYGSNTSYETRDAYAYNGSSWVRITLDRQDYTTYNTATNKYVAYTGTSTALSITSGTLTVSTKRHATSWSAYLRGFMNNTNDEWWAGTITNNDGTEDWHQWAWSGGLWVYRLRFMSVQSTYYNTAPIRALVSFRNASGTWTSENTYTISGSYSAQNTWGAYFTFNAKSSAGYTAVKMRYYNNTTYHVAVQSTRIGRYDIQTGTITNGTNWV